MVYRLHYKVSNINLFVPSPASARKFSSSGTMCSRAPSFGGSGRRRRAARLGRLEARQRRPVEDLRDGRRAFMAETICTGRPRDSRQPARAPQSRSATDPLWPLRNLARKHATRRPAPPRRVRRRHARLTPAVRHSGCIMPTRNQEDVRGARPPTSARSDRPNPAAPGSHRGGRATQATHPGP